MTTTVNDRVLGPGSNLRDRLTFPTFGDSPHEFEYDERYYTPPPPGSYIGSLSRHWCLLGEVLSVAMRDGKLSLGVQDMAGRTVRLVCRSKDGGKQFMDDGSCKAGRTVAVLYPLKHIFGDGDMGLAPEENSDLAVCPASYCYCSLSIASRFRRIQFLPFSLQQLLSANDKLWGPHPALCSAPDCQARENLQACSGCRLVRYCSKVSGAYASKYPSLRLSVMVLGTSDRRLGPSQGSMQGFIRAEALHRKKLDKIRRLLQLPLNSSRLYGSRS